jgi:hypothetical protein
VNKPAHLPNIDKLSSLIAMILLAYTLARFINIPIHKYSLQLPGLFVSFEINIRTIVVLLVAGLTATGADALLHQHPSIKGNSTLEHWLLPALTAWVIGFPLFQLPLGPQWWISFGLGGILLMLVLVAEYITVDPNDIRQPVATAGLSAVSFAIYLT